ncbi:MAG: hypothetical protein P8Y74_06955, partial [Desulfobacterales bacterium]
MESVTADDFLTVAAGERGTGLFRRRKGSQKPSSALCFPAGSHQPAASAADGPGHFKDRQVHGDD